ncbi:MAG: hypothetical protein Q7T70_13650 [Polaromonas sp.]|nr:hypothetical protein [Polaromonas sp.]
MSAEFRRQLLAAAEEAAFPAEKTLDPKTGVESLDPASEAALSRVFELFGVGALSPADEDFDKVVNTACTLSTEVAAHVEALEGAGGLVAGLEDAAEWHPDYRAYVTALWQGDREAIAAQAARLKLARGIPNGSLPLEDGPLG